MAVKTQAFQLFPCNLLATLILNRLCIPMYFIYAEPCFLNIRGPQKNVLDIRSGTVSLFLNLSFHHETLFFGKIPSYRRNFQAVEAFGLIMKDVL